MAVPSKLDAFGFDWNLDGVVMFALDDADDVEYENAALKLEDAAYERAEFNVSDMSLMRLGCGKKIKGSVFKKTTASNPIMFKTLGKPYPNKAK